MENDKWWKGTFYLFLILIIVLLIATFVHCFFVIEAVHSSSKVKIENCDNYNVYSSLLELKELQGKVFDDSVITFLVTLIITLLVTSGIFLIGKFEGSANEIKKRFEEQKSHFDQLKKEMEAFFNNSKISIDDSKNRLEALFNQSKDNIDQIQNSNQIHVISLCIYVFSTRVSDSHMINCNDESRKHNVFLSLCNKIDRHIYSINQLLPSLKSIDIKSRGILMYFLRETINNLDMYMRINKVSLDPANQTIADIQLIIDKINRLPGSDSDQAFDLLQ